MDEVNHQVETLQEQKNLGDCHDMLRKEKYERRLGLKKNKLQAFFNINPIITMNSSFSEIVQQVRKTKRSKEWIDADGMMRCSNIDIITHAAISIWLRTYHRGDMTISQIAKSSSYSYNRIKRGFNAAQNALQEHKDHPDKQSLAVNAMWKTINRKQLKFHWEQKAVIKCLRKLVYKRGVKKKAKEVRKEALRELLPFYPDLKLSISKVKRLLKRYVGVSYKRSLQINCAKMT